jgi:hypothetical protein
MNSQVGIELILADLTKARRKLRKKLERYLDRFEAEAWHKHRMDGYMRREILYASFSELEAKRVVK